MKTIFYIVAGEQKLAEAYDAMSATMIAKTFFDIYFNEPNLNISIIRVFQQEQPAAAPVQQEEKPAEKPAKESK